MPSKQGRVCAKCHDVHRESRCPACYKPWSTGQSRSWSQGSTAKWRRLRLVVLRDQPVCQVCKQRVAVAVDHIIPLYKDDSLRYSLSNLQSICKQCHKVKTQQESMEQRNLK